MIDVVNLAPGVTKYRKDSEGIEVLNVSSLRMISCRSDISTKYSKYRKGVRVLGQLYSFIYFFNNYMIN